VATHADAGTDRGRHAAGQTGQSGSILAENSHRRPAAPHPHLGSPASDLVAAISNPLLP